MLKKCFIIISIIAILATIMSLSQNIEESTPVGTEEEALRLSKEILGDEGIIEFAYKVINTDEYWVVFSNYDYGNREYYEKNYVGDDIFNEKSLRISHIVIRKKDGKVTLKESEYIDERLILYDPNGQNDSNNLKK